MNMALRSVPRRSQHMPMKNKAAAMYLASLVALLLADSANGFLAAPPTGSTAVAGTSSLFGCNRVEEVGHAFRGRRRSMVVGTRKPRGNAAAGKMAKMAVEGAQERSKLALETADAIPRGPAGAIKLTYLEINSWMWQVNGLNLLVDPLFGNLDFGVPFLIDGKKRVLSDSERVMRELAEVTDFLIISQGFYDHCHPPTIQALAGLLKPSVRLVAPPSAGGVLEEHFPASRITYILPGESTVLSAGGRAVEIKATSGATLGPPWQQAENGFVVRPAAPNGTGKAPPGGSLYYEPHVMYDEAELSEMEVDIVITPVVQQLIGPFALVSGGAKALNLASTLSASKVVTMANGEADFTGPLGDVVKASGTLEEFQELARDKDISVVVPEPAKTVSVWP